MVFGSNTTSAEPRWFYINIDKRGFSKGANISPQLKQTILPYEICTVRNCFEEIIITMTFDNQAVLEAKQGTKIVTL